MSEHADWWNVPVHRLGDLDTMRDRAGSARVSAQMMVSFVPPGGRGRGERCCGSPLPARGGNGAMAMGDGAAVTDAFGALADRGVERLYAWFADFAPPSTLEAFAPRSSPSLRWRAVPQADSTARRSSTPASSAGCDSITLCPASRLTTSTPGPRFSIIRAATGGGTGMSCVMPTYVVGMPVA